MATTFVSFLSLLEVLKVKPLMHLENFLFRKSKSMLLRNIWIIKETKLNLLREAQSSDLSLTKLTNLVQETRAEIKFA